MEEMGAASKKNYVNWMREEYLLKGGKRKLNRWLGGDDCRRGRRLGTLVWGIDESAVGRTNSSVSSLAS